MRYSFLPGILCAALVVAACSDSTAPPTGEANAATSSPLRTSAGGSQVIPVAFVTEFRAFLSGDSRSNGSSGRTQDYICLQFSVQEGDLEGDMETCFSANNPSDQTASQGPGGWFSTSVPDYSEYEVCMPSTGWCGTFSETASAGKVYPLPRGVDFPNSVALGGGDFEGMVLKGIIYECPDSQGDRGCFSGYLEVPASR